MRTRRLLQKLRSGSKSIRFSKAAACAKSFGFELSGISGDPDMPFVFMVLKNLKKIRKRLQPHT
jgi:hypothetical protein